MNPGAGKRFIEVLAKGLDYALLTTELAAKTCHDTRCGKQRLCSRNNFSNVPHFTKNFTYFTIDERIDDQIDMVTASKIARRGPGQPETQSIPGAFQFCGNVLKHRLGVVQPGLETYVITEYNFDLIPRDE